MLRLESAKVLVVTSIFRVSLAFNRNRSGLTIIHKKRCSTRMPIQQRVLSLNQLNGEVIHVLVQILQLSHSSKVERDITHSELFTVN